MATKKKETYRDRAQAWANANPSRASIPVTAPPPQAATPAPTNAAPTQKKSSAPVQNNPLAVPPSAYGTSSAQYGQVNRTGQVEKSPAALAAQYPNSTAGPAPGKAGVAPMPLAQPQTKLSEQPLPTPLPQVQQPQSMNPQDTSQWQATFQTANKVNSDGTTTPFNVEQGKSFVSQTGTYQYPPFTTDGNKERLAAIKELFGSPWKKDLTVGIGGKYVPGASEMLETGVGMLEVASIASSLAEIYSFAAGMGKIGSIALTPGGAATLAEASPEAAGVVKTVASAGVPAVNTINNASRIKALTGVMSRLGMGNAAIGYVLAASGLSVPLTSSISGAASTDESISKFAEEVGNYLPKLRDAGMNDEADELNDLVKDLRDGLDVAVKYIPLIGKSIESSKISGYKDKMNSITDSYEAKIKADEAFVADVALRYRLGEEVSPQDVSKAAKIDPDILLLKQAADKLAAEKAAQPGIDAQKAADAQASKEEQRRYNEQREAEGRTYSEGQKEDQRAYNEQQQAEQRAYNEAQQAKADEMAQDASDTATETSGGSVLNFGLLSSSGALEFVDRDKASQVYFGKPYELLDPAQRRLLELSKGKGGG